MFVENPEVSYIALTADLVGSRQLIDRESSQRQLSETLGRLNEQLRDSIVGDLAIVSGDEFQGLFVEPRQVLDVVIEVSERLFPQEVSFGVGWGNLTTGLKKDAVGQMDGPCFHRAREALNAAKSRRRWVIFRGFGPDDDTLLSIQFALMNALRQKWTERQARIAFAVRKSLTQKDVAEQLNVSPSVISESLKATDFKEIQEMEKAAEEHLSRVVTTLRERDKLVRELRLADGRRQELRFRREKLLAENARARHQAMDARSELTEVVRQIEQVRQESIRLRADVEAERQVNVAREKNTAPVDLLEDLRREVARAQSELATEVARFEELQPSFERSRAEFDALRREIQVRREELTISERELDQLRKRARSFRRG